MLSSLKLGMTYDDADEIVGLSTRRGQIKEFYVLCGSGGGLIEKRRRSQN